MTYEKLIQEMDAKLQFPGLSNTWTMPVENRLDMELTGIKTPLGMKIQGPNLEGIQQVGAQVQQILSAIPEMRSIFAERVSQGFYLNIEVNRAEAARYGLTIADVQQAVTSGIGGETIAENVEGRERYPVNVRYNRDFRDNVEALQTRPDWHALRRANSHFRSREALVFARAFDDPRRRRRTDRLRLHRPQHERLRRIRPEGEQLAQAKTRPASRLHLQMVRRIRI